MKISIYLSIWKRRNVSPFFSCLVFLTPHFSVSSPFTIRLWLANVGPMTRATLKTANEKFRPWESEQNQRSSRMSSFLYSLTPPTHAQQNIAIKKQRKNKNALFLWRLFHSLLKYFDFDFIDRQFNVIAPFYVPSCSHHLSAATAVFVLFCVCVPPYSIRPAAVSIYL